MALLKSYIIFSWVVLFLFMTIQDQLRYLKAKIRNVVYYRLDIEPTLDYRIRCQYIHILRTIRSEIVQILPDLEEGDDKKVLIKIMDLINPKIKSGECEQVIQKICQVLIENVDD